MPLFRVTAGAEYQPKRADCKGTASAGAARAATRLADGGALASGQPDATGAREYPVARARSLSEFQASFPDETSCAAFLYERR